MIRPLNWPQMKDDPLNGAVALHRAGLRLAAAGVETPARDAQRLLAHILGRAPHFASDITLTHQQAAQFETAITAREARQPVAQIIGRRAFWRHEFEVTQDTLDPRPDTETLIEAALARNWTSALDLGTGTGAIAISLACERPGARVVGVDCSDAALAVARRNNDRIGAGVELIRSDWFDHVEGRFDLIVSNPPYIAASEMADLSPEVRQWEPRLALTDEGDGLNAYRAIIRAAPRHLFPQGWLMVEIGRTQARAVSALMAEAGLTGITTRQDLNGQDRVISGQNPALE